MQVQTKGWSERLKVRLIVKFKYASISLDGSVFVVGGESFKPKYQLVSIIAKYRQGIHELKISI